MFSLLRRFILFSSCVCISSTGVCGWVRRIAKACVDLMPFGEEMLASKLSAITWTRPPSLEEIPSFSLLLAAAWAAELLKRSTSSYEHVMPKLCSRSIIVLSRMTTPREISRNVGLLETAHVTMFPTIAAGRFDSSFCDIPGSKVNNVGLLLARASSRHILVSYVDWSRLSSGFPDNHFGYSRCGCINILIIGY